VVIKTRGRTLQGNKKKKGKGSLIGSWATGFVADIMLTAGKLTHVFANIRDRADKSILSQ